MVGTVPTQGKCHPLHSTERIIVREKKKDMSGRKQCVKDAWRDVGLKPVESTYVLLQVCVISIIHFWIGVGIGTAMDKLHETEHMNAWDHDPKEGKKLNRGRAMGQISLVIMLTTLSFVLAQSILWYFYRAMYCIKGSLKLADPRDAHAIHAGFGMVFGIAWSSGNTLSKPCPGLISQSMA
jgi:hypothetical protein